MEITEVEELLEKISKVVKEYDKRLLEQGDLYNIFQVTKIDYDEVRLHTRIIHDLLNPHGLHGQGKLFLELFINKFVPEGFNITTPKADKEAKLGLISMDPPSGGSIDITITNNSGQAIFIENKIFGQDQLNQILRYYNSGKKKYRNFFKLFYLTPYGKCPGAHSVGCLKENEDFHCISYKSDIINWLVECKKISIDKPLLRETLTQYINTLKEMTGQTISHELEEKIKRKIIANKNNYDVAKSIINAFNKFYEEQIERLKRIKSKFENSSEIENECFDIDISGRGILIKIEVGFEVNELYIGVYIDPNNIEIETQLHGKIETQLIEKIAHGKKDLRFQYNTDDVILINSIENTILDVTQVLKENSCQ